MKRITLALCLLFVGLILLGTGGCGGNEELASSPTQTLKPEATPTTPETRYAAGVTSASDIAVMKVNMNGKELSLLLPSTAGDGYWTILVKNTGTSSISSASIENTVNIGTQREMVVKTYVMQNIAVGEVRFLGVYATFSEGGAAIRVTDLR